VAGGGWVRWRMAGGGVLVVGEAVGGGGCGWIWVKVGEGRRCGVGVLYGRNGEMRGEWGKCDLKTGQERPSSSTFDRT
jgi:hypothetical protein